MEIVGWTLVAGLVVFLVGAGGWRMAYEAPLEEALVTIHGDRRRRAWIHGWMLPAMFLTAAGLAALPFLLEDATARALAAMAAAVFALGAVCWVLSLTFRLTVVPDAAADLVDRAAIPDHFRPLDRWASSMYATHMASAYVAAALLGAALLATEGHKLEYPPDGVRRIAEVAWQVNERTENIGARRLHTVMERLLETISFEAADRGNETTVVDAAYVDQHLGSLVGNEDLARYIL